MHTQTTVGRGHQCKTAQHRLRSAKYPSSHHVTMTGQQFCVGSAKAEHSRTVSGAL